MAKRGVRTLQEVMDQGFLMTVPEVSQALCLSEPSFYGLVKRGRMPPISGPRTWWA